MFGFPFASFYHEELANYSGITTVNEGSFAETKSPMLIF